MSHDQHRNPARVALVRCDSYDSADVDRAVARGFSLLGDVSSLFHPDEQILIKPNMLQAAPQDKAVCVHPEVFRAVAEKLQSLGVKLSYGDSPAVSSPRNAAQVNGIAGMADKIGIPLADFRNGTSISTPDNCRIKKFEIANGVLKSDGVVSISKLKTHAFTTMTGAVKNQLGCIPGMRKAELHARFPDPDQFSRMLVELALTVSPRLHVMDGIVAMEGKGPSAGTPRSMKVLLLSTDPVALDAVATRLIGLNINAIDVLKHGKDSGLGNPDNVEVLGDDPLDLTVHDFKHPDISFFKPDSFLVRLFRELVLTQLVIDPKKCSHCGQCVSICPVIPKALSQKSAQSTPTHHSKNCIRCFCCQEVCPEHAIDTKTPIAGRCLHRISRN